MSGKTMVEFEKIYLEYRDNIFRVCAMMVRDPSLAEDCAQETFYKALRRYRSFRKKSSVKTWLTSIAVNVCRDRLRKKSSAEITTDTLCDSAYEENIDNKLSVTEAVRALPDELREAVILYYYQQLTQREIAEMLGVGETKIAYRLKKAKAQLRDYLTED